MKKRSFIAGMLTMLLLISLLGTVSAVVQQEQATITYTNTKIILNGEEISLTTTTGDAVRPFQIDGTTYLPLRSLSNILGLNVDWDSSNGNITLTNPEATPSPAPNASSKTDINGTGTTVSIPILTPISPPSPSPSPEPTTPPIDDYNNRYAAYKAEFDAINADYSTRISALKAEKASFRQQYFNEAVSRGLDTYHAGLDADKMANRVYDAQIQKLETEFNTELEQLKLKYVLFDDYNDRYAVYKAEFDAINADYSTRISALKAEKASFRQQYFNEAVSRGLDTYHAGLDADEMANRMYDAQIQELETEFNTELEQLKLKYIL